MYPVIALDPTVAGAVQTKFTPAFAGDPLTPVGIPGTPLVYEITTEPFPLFVAVYKYEAVNSAIPLVELEPGFAPAPNHSGALPIPAPYSIDPRSPPSAPPPPPAPPPPSQRPSEVITVPFTIPARHEYAVYKPGWPDVDVTSALPEKVDFEICPFV